MQSSKTLRVVLTAKHQGWCYIIPVKDEKSIQLYRLPDDKYAMHEDGVIYVPADEIGKDEDLKVRVYKQNRNITEHVKALSRVKNTHYHYLQFYIPGNTEQEPDSVKGGKRFDSLLAAQRIVFN